MREDAEDEAGKSYAILISDTLIVKPEGAAPEVATAATPKDWKEVAYYLKVRFTYYFKFKRVYSKHTGLQIRHSNRIDQHHACLLLAYQGEDEAGDADDDDAVRMQAAGMRKSSRTEQVDFRMKDDER